jgi:excisionase family DNA binding protein
MFGEKAMEEIPVSYSPQDVSKLLGLSKSFVYKLLDTGELKHYKIGRRKVVLRGDFLEWFIGKEKKG